MLPELTKHITKKNILIALFTTFLITLVVGALNIQQNVAYASGDVKLNTIYHVYLDDVHIGPVNDKEAVETAIETAIEQETKQREDAYTLGVKQDVTFVKETAFQLTDQTESTIEQVEDALEIDVEATALQFDGETVGYFKDQEAIDTLLFNYQKQYVSEDVLNELSADESDEKQVVRDNVVIKDVTFSRPVETSTSVVSEDDLLSVDEGLRLLEKGTLTDKIHTVQTGDTLFSIVKQYDLTLDQLLDINSDLTESSVLQLDQEINVTAYAPFVDVVVKQEKQVEEVIKFETIVEETDALYKGETRTITEGSDGAKDVTYDMELVNGKVTTKEVIESTVTKEVVNKTIEKGTKVIPSRGTGDFSWPAVGGYLSSSYGPRWGSFHKGIDIARPSNRNIIASDNGVVEKISYDAGGYGHYLVVNHNNGYKTLYAHLSNISVNVGQTVPKGAVLGTMGSTGRSTGIHLHFEVLKNGSNINPATVLY
ncbi:metalloendopeptidase [Halolactibacillus miurensis]|uniref:Metalloendopeptidase n=1 Tax=Halolactibacillus miurensis TaxID=306541 RepID=A0A1I6NWX7_9BACI|nr:M23 family metallopeptidase [Halolactibacillus miurensis]GEM05187.1 metalloendopeptidase [Halolactibacillus miurensis]SFS32359.1 Murein DD-endopeptidase MepM and murein hydrolase activator NlpD, contain LysM domain [Halolactibacillus miurensis]